MLVTIYIIIGFRWLIKKIKSSQTDNFPMTYKSLFLSLPWIFALLLSFLNLIDSCFIHLDDWLNTLTL